MVSWFAVSRVSVKHKQTRVTNPLCMCCWWAFQCGSQVNTKIIYSLSKSNTLTKVTVI